MRERRSETFLAAVAVCLLVFGSTAIGDVPAGPLTPSDAVATTRFMSVGPTEELISRSPDGLRYIVRLVRGDRIRNGVWIDILCGSLISLKAAVPSVVAHLFSTGRGVPGYGGASADSVGYLSPVRWVNSRKIAFLFSDKRERRQIVTVDLLSKRIEFETAVTTQLQAFDIAASGDLVYLADTSPPDVKKAAIRGFVVPEGTDAMSIVAGYFDGSTADSRDARAVWFAKSAGHSAKRITFVDHRVDGGYPQVQHVSLSPDGSHAIVTARAGAIPAEWEAYLGRTFGFSSPSFESQFRTARADPTSVEARRIVQFFLVDVGRSTARPLWDALAPQKSWLSSWSSDGRFVILSPIPIPVAEQTRNRTDLQTVIFDIFSGEHWFLPTGGTAVQRVTWRARDKVDLDRRTAGQDVTECYTVAKGSRLREADCSVGHSTTGHTIDINVREHLNAPPRLFALDKSSGSEHEILNPNPALNASYKLGIVKYLEGVLSTGERWSGQLTLPVEYEAGKGYPLVMQSQGTLVSPSKFTLYGWAQESGLGPCLIAPYAAQTLAGRGIAVLHFGVEAKYGGPAEAEVTQRAFEELARKLVADGVVDERRIGISGFSRMGYLAYHAISHSKFPFAAAVVADNVDYSYVQTVLGANYSDAATAIGAPAFGVGLQTWFQRATGFNVEAIRAPLLLIGQSSGAQVNILQQWEILSRLRWLQRPVEMYLMPDIDAHPSHNMQNPNQVIAVQERAVDWFDFWLNDHEMPVVQKAVQYERWRRLRLLRTIGTEKGAPQPQ
jgi:dipeptidyl aminopeptidase/acylaminoacyl peptidase